MSYLPIIGKGSIKRIPIKHVAINHLEGIGRIDAEFCWPQTNDRTQAPVCIVNSSIFSSFVPLP